MRTPSDVELNPGDVPAGVDSTGQQRGLPGLSYVPVQVGLLMVERLCFV